MSRTHLYVTSLQEPQGRVRQPYVDLFWRSLGMVYVLLEVSFDNIGLFKSSYVDVLRGATSEGEAVVCIYMYAYTFDEIGFF